MWRRHCSPQTNYPESPAGEGAMMFVSLSVEKKIWWFTVSKTVYNWIPVQQYHNIYTVFNISVSMEDCGWSCKIFSALKMTEISTGFTLVLFFCTAGLVGGLRAACPQRKGYSLVTGRLFLDRYGAWLCHKDSAKNNTTQSEVFRVL